MPTFEENRIKVAEALDLSLKRARLQNLVTRSAKKGGKDAATSLVKDYIATAEALALETVAHGYSRPKNPGFIRDGYPMKVPGNQLGQSLSQATATLFPHIPREPEATKNRLTALTTRKAFNARLRDDNMSNQFRLEMNTARTEGMPPAGPLAEVLPPFDDKALEKLDTNINKIDAAVNKLVYNPTLNNRIFSSEEDKLYRDDPDIRDATLESINTALNQDKYRSIMDRVRQHRPAPDREPAIARTNWLNEATLQGENIDQPLETQHTLDIPTRDIESRDVNNDEPPGIDPALRENREKAAENLRIMRGKIGAVFDEAIQQERRARDALLRKPDGQSSAIGSQTAEALFQFDTNDPILDLSQSHTETPKSQANETGNPLGPKERAAHYAKQQNDADNNFNEAIEDLTNHILAERQNNNPQHNRGGGSSISPQKAMMNAAVDYLAHEVQTLPATNRQTLPDNVETYIQTMGQLLNQNFEPGPQGLEERRAVLSILNDHINYDSIDVTTRASFAKPTATINQTLQQKRADTTGNQNAGNTPTDINANTAKNLADALQNINNTIAQEIINQAEAKAKKRPANTRQSQSNSSHDEDQSDEDDWQPKPGDDKGKGEARAKSAAHQHDQGGDNHKPNLSENQGKGTKEPEHQSGKQDEKSNISTDLSTLGSIPEADISQAQPDIQHNESPQHQPRQQDEKSDTSTGLSTHGSIPEADISQAQPDIQPTPDDLVESANPSERSSIIPEGDTVLDASLPPADEQDLSGFEDPEYLLPTQTLHQLASIEAIATFDLYEGDYTDNINTLITILDPHVPELLTVDNQMEAEFKALEILNEVDQFRRNAGRTHQATPQSNVSNHEQSNSSETQSPERAWHQSEEDEKLSTASGPQAPPTPPARPRPADASTDTTTDDEHSEGPQRKRMRPTTPPRTLPQEQEPPSATQPQISPEQRQILNAQNQRRAAIARNQRRRSIFNNEGRAAQINFDESSDSGPEVNPNPRPTTRPRTQQRTQERTRPITLPQEQEPPSATQPQISPEQRQILNAQNQRRAAIARNQRRRSIFNNEGRAAQINFDESSDDEPVANPRSRQNPLDNRGDRHRRRGSGLGD